MAEATRCLSLSEAGAKNQQKAPKSKANQRYPPGLEWEILNADATVLLGITHALRCVTALMIQILYNINRCSESYMGYLQCM